MIECFGVFSSHPHRPLFSGLSRWSRRGVCFEVTGEARDCFDKWQAHHALPTAILAAYCRQMPQGSSLSCLFVFVFVWPHVTRESSGM